MSRKAKGLSLLFVVVMGMLFLAAYEQGEKPQSTHLHPSLWELEDRPYYFPTKASIQSKITYQVLQRFDLIFVGHDPQQSPEISDAKRINLAYAIPGHYTHVLMYVGKDSNGLAYAVEMNADKDQTFRVTPYELTVGGQLYLYCLGSDYAARSCPNDTYIYGLETYDYMQAKRLEPRLYQQLIQQEAGILSVMQEDLEQGYPFQIPVHFSLETSLSKAIPLIDDGRQHGADCVSYFVSLFEEVAGVCLDEVRIGAAELTEYYSKSEEGRKALLPARYNFVHHETIPFRTILNELGYRLVDTPVRQTRCSDQRTVQGIATPDRLFRSSSTVAIDRVLR
ncbi:MAG TPA: hypothetical protein ENK86_05470 [Campylobacterales bacterium]|nr:hypothetical protein [Campylobacterales bacterium]